MMRYAFPERTRVSKTVPKSKIYEHTAADTSLKEKFIDQVDKILWSRKLAEETPGLPATEKVPEIVIFDLYLKGGDIDETLLRAIDRAIPLPIFFYLHRSDGRIKAKAAYKRPSEANSRQWVIESYFESDWFDAETPTKPLPSAVDLEKLYAALIKALMPQSVSGSIRADDIEAEVERAKLLKAKEREYQRLKARRDREKQFNKKLKLNEELHRLEKEIENIKNSLQS
jgi:cytochrome c556